MRRKQAGSGAISLALCAGLVAASAVILFGCAKPDDRPSSTSAVTVKGSDTMVHLVSDWAESFMEESPETNISVTGGGSGTGIAALINGTTDICMSSRDMSAEEKAQAQSKGITPSETLVARDGIAVVVNPANPVNELSMEQVGKIFVGATPNWSAVGGPDRGIILLSRESSSGTYVFFQEHVLKKKDYAASTRLLPATSGIIQAVAEDQAAIGYVGLGYAIEAGERVKTLAIRADDASPAIVPSENTVLDGTYPISRPLFLYTGQRPSDGAQAFVSFCLSVKGQTIVREAGYVPVAATP